jgi:hypothetical protein
MMASSFQGILDKTKGCVDLLVSELLQREFAQHLP